MDCDRREKMCVLLLALFVPQARVVIPETRCYTGDVVLFKSVVRLTGGFISFGVGSCVEVQIGRLILGWVDFYAVGFLMSVS